MSIKASLCKIKDKAMASTNGQPAANTKVGGTKTNSMDSAFISVLLQLVQSSDSGR